MLSKNITSTSQNIVFKYELKKIKINSEEDCLFVEKDT